MEVTVQSVVDGAEDGVAKKKKKEKKAKSEEVEDAAAPDVTVEVEEGVWDAANLDPDFAKSLPLAIKSILKKVNKPTLRDS